MDLFRSAWSWLGVIFLCRIPIFAALSSEAFIKNKIRGYEVRVPTLGTPAGRECPGRCLAQHTPVMCPPQGTYPRAPLRLKMGCLTTSSWALWGKHRARKGAGKTVLMRGEVWRRGGAYRKGEIILLIKGQIGPRGWEVILYAYKVWRVWLVQSNRDLCWCQIVHLQYVSVSVWSPKGETESTALV